MIEKILCYGVFVIFLLSAISCGCLGESPPGPAAPAEDSGLRIITEDFPPYNYIDEDGNITGQSTDVVNGILEKLNMKADIELMPWGDGYNIVLNEPATALYSTGRTTEREPLFKWAGPIASYETVLYAKADSGIEIDSLEAAKKAGSIAVVRDDSRQQFLTENRFENLILCEDDTECLGKLMDGEAVLWFGSSANAEEIAFNAGYDPAALSAVYPVRTVGLYIAFNSVVPDETVSEWQDALDSMKADGTYGAILARYDLTEPGAAVEYGPETALFALMSYCDGRMTSVQRGLETAAVTSEATSGDWQEIKPILAEIEDNEPDARMWYSYTNGTYYTVVDGLASANLMNRSYFPLVLSGQESIGTVVVSYSTGKSTAIVAVPVKEDDDVTGVLGASVYLEGITEALKDELPGTVFYAVDKEGKFALNSDKGLISQEVMINDGNTSFGRAVEYMLFTGEGSVEYESQGKNWNAEFRKSPLTGWIYAVAESS